MAARSGATQTVVSGTERFKYFKRPVMPRVSAIAPQVLLAPTTMDDPLVAVNTYVEPSMKDVEIQTMYRDSEAQTTPYTPAYVTNDGENPEILLLKKLTYENGLPLGKKEIDMLEYARAKREMEMNLPPFTDEASLSLRKKLMEQQEMREFRLRETEIDRKREEKLEELQMTMMEREESNEFMVSQRLEGVRLLRMEEKEKILQKIRNKRVKALRRIAHQRNVSDPVLSDGTSRDIINDYFDRGSTVYAPVPREGKENDVQTSRYDVASRTVPLHNIGNILSLEYTIPRRYLDADGHEDKNNMAPTHLSKTAPVGSAVNMRNNGGGGRASEDRLTSAAARTIRNTKRDIEEMHSILSQRKHTFPAAAMLHLNNNNTQPLSPGTAGGQHSRDFNDTRKFKGRPTTPDFTANRATTTNQQTNTFENDEEAGEFQRAVILLQRLLRGRAVQNIMFEGKYRRSELINELKMADDARMLHHEADVNKIDLELKIERETAIRESTLNTVAGSLASSILTTLAQEKNRVELITSLEQFAVNAVLERRMREEAEAGRRQKEGLGK